jgi:hypothetical protein
MIICNIFGERNCHMLYKILGEHDKVIQINMNKINNIIIL